MIYEVINPSDAMTIESSDLKVAQAAILFLGNGQISLTDENGDEALPLFLFGGGDEWIEERFGDFAAWADAHLLEIAEVLESLVYCSILERKAVMAALGEEATPAALLRWNDTMRSSLNDYSTYAHTLAKTLRKKASLAEAGAEEGPGDAEG